MKDKQTNGQSNNEHQRRDITRLAIIIIAVFTLIGVVIFASRWLAASGLL
jgi:hypothetical protein